MKTKLVIAIITIAASLAFLSSCKKDPIPTGINYTISKFECTNGSGAAHENAESLKSQMEMACKVCKDFEVSMANTYLGTVISSWVQTSKSYSYSYDITISYSGIESGTLIFKDSSL